MTRYRRATAWGEGCFRRGRSEQERSELLLLPAGAVARLEKEMSRRCLGYMIIWL
jgi:hypothetical protein